MSGVFVVIPAYNEQSKIVEVLSDLKSNGYKNIVVVDDGSKDQTAQVVKRLGVQVLTHVINRGQGAALKTGIDYVLSKKADIIITFDADGQHVASDIKKLVEPIKKKQAEVVLGSRFLKGSKSNISPSRKMLLKGGKVIIQGMYGIQLTDSHNGLRAFSKNAASKIQIKSNGMEHASEILEEIAKKKLRYMEVPVNIRYTDYSKSHGQSPYNAVNILFKMVMKKLMR